MQFQAPGFQGAGQDDDDYGPDERQRIEQAVRDHHDRMKSLYQRSEDEQKSKNDKKQQARVVLKQWQQDREKQITQTKKLNKESEKDYYEEDKRMKNTNNQWERIISNVEINGAQYVGGCDVGRMRQAMIARKGDITKGGITLKKTL